MHAPAGRGLLGLIPAAIVAALTACAGTARDGEPASPAEETVRYIALGDSYTIGTSVAESESWPSQLAARMDGVELVANLGVNGYTSRDLIERQLPDLDALEPQLVTVLIGVNDVVQGVPDAEYAANVALILDGVLEHVSPDATVCVATPDYTLTPRGSQFGDPMEQSDRIVRVNAILAEACEQRGIRFVPDIFEISQRVIGDPSLVADDGLHPSGAQYRLWTDAIEPAVRRALEPGV